MLEGKCSDSIHCARKWLLQNLAAELYNPPRHPPLTLSLPRTKRDFNPLALHSSPFSCARPCAHRPTSAGHMSTRGFEPGSSDTKCNGSIQSARKGLFQSLAAKLYNPPMHPPLTLSFQGPTTIQSLCVTKKLGWVWNQLKMDL